MSDEESKIIRDFMSLIEDLQNERDHAQEQVAHYRAILGLVEPPDPVVPTGVFVRVKTHGVYRSLDVTDSRFPILELWKWLVGLDDHGLRRATDIVRVALRDKVINP